MPFLGQFLRCAVVCLAKTSVFIAIFFYCGIPVSMLAAAPLEAQTAQAMAPNSDATYQALRNLTLSGEAVTVSNFDLKRDTGTFHLRSGTVCFTAPVQGKVTGAVFVGDGNFVIAPPPSELGMLKLLTKENEFSENFSHLVLRFTDSTYEEVKTSNTPALGGCDSGLFRDSQNAMRHGRTLKHNLEIRMLQDVLSAGPGGLFVAFVHGKRYDDKEIFVVDPQGAEYVM